MKSSIKRTQWKISHTRKHFTQRQGGGEEDDVEENR